MQPVSAYFSSDEEKDDEEDILLYLPIAPEVEDPEDGWNPAAELEESAGGNKRNNQEQKENGSPKKKRTKSYDIALANAPSDGK